MEEKGLKQAFALFSQESVRLKKAYRSLQKKIDLLHQRLTESDLTLSMVIAHMMDGLIFVNNDGRIQFFNPAAGLLTGKRQQEVTGSLFSNHFPDRLFGFSVSRSLEKKNVHASSLITLKNEHAFEVETTASSVAEKGLLILLRDRTEIRQLEQSVQRNERLKELGEMAATLAHEIRNPLGGIEGFASLLERDLKEDPVLTPMVSAILSGVKTLNELVANVLDYARPFHLCFAQSNLVLLLQQARDLMNADPANKCRCAFESDRDEYWEAVDKERLKLALCHLIRNGFEASPENGTVYLKLNDNRIQIIDSGKGIAKEHLEMIFTPFFTTKVSGSGIGLSEAHKIIQGHGWQMHIKSELENGTTITIQVRDPCQSNPS